MHRFLELCAALATCGDAHERSAYLSDYLQDLEQEELAAALAVLGGRFTPALRLSAAALKKAALQLVDADLLALAHAQASDWLEAIAFSLGGENTRFPVSITTGGASIGKNKLSDASLGRWLGVLSQRQTAIELLDSLTEIPARQRLFILRLATVSPSSRRPFAVDLRELWEALARSFNSIPRDIAALWHQPDIDMLGLVTWLHEPVHARKAPSASCFRLWQWPKQAAAIAPAAADNLRIPVGIDLQLLICGPVHAAASGQGARLFSMRGEEFSMPQHILPEGLSKLEKMPKACTLILRLAHKLPEHSSPAALQASLRRANATKTDARQQWRIYLLDVWQDKQGWLSLEVLRQLRQCLAQIAPHWVDAAECPASANYANFIIADVDASNGEQLRLGQRKAPRRHITAQLMHLYQPGGQLRAPVTLVAGLWQEEQTLVPLTKVEAQLTNEECEALRQHVKTHCVARHGPLRELARNPETAVRLRLTYAQLSAAPRRKCKLNLHFVQVEKIIFPNVQADLDCASGNNKNNQLSSLEKLQDELG
ncbi:hypothetical protein [Polycladidibacter hongkongensis]|uniref:hypothetical protein n=1 Tax=Polycladidibacter hongkongensis TaxID=1647556 RepID=UPI00083509FA|nr:hypothetical protein [Pseudovibrio hongkongensis]